MVDFKLLKKIYHFYNLSIKFDENGYIKIPMNPFKNKNVGYVQTKENAQYYLDSNKNLFEETVKAHLIEEKFCEMERGFPVSSRFRFKDTLNDLTMSIREFGLDLHWNVISLMKNNFEAERNREKVAQSIQMINLRDLTAVFLFLFIGLAFSFVVLVVENIFFYFKMKKIDLKIRRKK